MTAKKSIVSADGKLKVTSEPATEPAASTAVTPAPAVEPTQQVLLGKCTYCANLMPFAKGECVVCGYPVTEIK